MQFPHRPCSSPGIRMHSWNGPSLFRHPSQTASVTMPYCWIAAANLEIHEVRLMSAMVVWDRSCRSRFQPKLSVIRRTGTLSEVVKILLMCLCCLLGSDGMFFQLALGMMMFVVERSDRKEVGDGWILWWTADEAERLYLSQNKRKSKNCIVGCEIIYARRWPLCRRSAMQTDGNSVCRRVRYSKEQSSHDLRSRKMWINF